MNKQLSEEERCQIMVSPPDMWGAFHQHQCRKKAVVVRDGKRYCKIHDPKSVVERRRARTEKYNKEVAKRRIQWSGHMLLAACKEALEASHNPIVERILSRAITKTEKK